MHVQVLFADSNFENPVTLYAGLQKLVTLYELVKYKTHNFTCYALQLYLSLLL